MLILVPEKEKTKEKNYFRKIHTGGDFVVKLAAVQTLRRGTEYNSYIADTEEDYETFRKLLWDLALED